jgi:large subunit ribosomal protein L29
MKTGDLRKLSAGELRDKLEQNKTDLFKLRFQHATAQLEKTDRLPLTRKSIARIMTVLKEKERGA